MAKFGPPLLWTAASLKQGGLQDVCMNWKPTPTKTAPIALKLADGPFAVA